MHTFDYAPTKYMYFKKDFDHILLVQIPNLRKTVASILMYFYENLKKKSDNYQLYNVIHTFHSLLV